MKKIKGKVSDGKIGKKEEENEEASDRFFYEKDFTERVEELIMAYKSGSISKEEAQKELNIAKKIMKTFKSVKMIHPSLD